MHSKSVLVVEDNDDLRLFVDEMLTGAGHQVLAASSADGALELWAGAGKAIPVALIDLTLGGTTGGQELAARLKADSPTVQLILTTGGVPTFSPELSWLNTVPFLQKPFSSTRLLAVVSRAQALHF